MGDNLIFKSFKFKTKEKDKINLENRLHKIIESKNPKFLKSFMSGYRYSYSKKLLKKFSNIKNINIFGMGGSSLGSKAIYTFLKIK